MPLTSKDISRLLRPKQITKALPHNTYVSSRINKEENRTTHTFLNRGATRWSKNQVSVISHTTLNDCIELHSIFSLSTPIKSVIKPKYKLANVTRPTTSSVRTRLGVAIGFLPVPTSSGTDFSKTPCDRSIPSSGCY